MSGVRSYVSGMSLVLLLASVLLGGLFYRQWHTDIAAQYHPPTRGANEDAAGADEPGKVAPYAPIPLSGLREITERPLFVEGRTPPEKPAQESATVPASPLRLKLEGVAITPESKVAIITDLTTKDLLRLSQGMSHADWKIVEVTQDSVTIQQGARQMKLNLEIDESAPGTRAGGRTRVPFRLPVPRSQPTQ